MTAFAPLLGLLEEVPDHRRAEGKVYQLAHVLLFSILAIVSGGNSYRSIVTFIEMHRHRLNEVFGLTWRRAPAHTAIRYILQGLDGDAVEAAFRRHANLLQAAHAKPGGGSLAIDGKTLRGSFDGFCQNSCQTRRREVKPEFSLRRFENGEHTASTPEVKQATAVGRDVLVVASAGAQEVAELVIACGFR